MEGFSGEWWSPSFRREDFIDNEVASVVVVVGDSGGIEFEVLFDDDGPDHGEAFAPE